MNLIEREEEFLEQQLDEGRITVKEFNAEMNELRMRYIAAKREKAQDAYDEEMERY